MVKKLKDQILELRVQGLSYKQIKDTLNCGKAIVSYHCRMNHLGGEKPEILTIEERKKRNYERVKTHRQKIKEKGVEYLGGKCELCGYSKSIWAFDFHHRDPAKKEFGICEYSRLAWETVRKELDKCMLLCSNCHRELHHEEFNK